VVSEGSSAVPREDAARLGHPCQRRGPEASRRPGGLKGAVQ